MDIQLILGFLRDVAANNTRAWFKEHRADYDAARCEWEHGVAQARDRIITFDPDVARQPLKDCTYRFYRDTRFSPDKSPYKKHFGAYINAHGKKALRGGYYLHAEPGNCLLAVGNYWLPTNILTACRNEIMANEAQWLQAVQSPDFRHYFAPDPVGNLARQIPPDVGCSASRRVTLAETEWSKNLACQIPSAPTPAHNNDVGADPVPARNVSTITDDPLSAPCGFGMMKLKTCPAGFPRDYAHVRYLRLKDYCAWHHVEESFFASDDWLDEMEHIFRTAKPMMDFTNSVIDDYE